MGYIGGYNYRLLTSWEIQVTLRSSTGSPIRKGAGALLLCAPTCSSWCRVSRGTTWRTTLNPMGLDYQFVSDGNLTISRQVKGKWFLYNFGGSWKYLGRWTIFIYLPEVYHTPWKCTLRKVVFEPPFFRGYVLNFRGAYEMFAYHTLDPVLLFGTY